jgi:hypothetical protein
MLLTPALLPTSSRGVDWHAVGYMLAGVLEAVRPDAVAEWWDRLGTLAELLDLGDDAGAMRWLGREFPALARVARRHQRALLRGLVEAANVTELRKFP